MSTVTNWKTPIGNSLAYEGVFDGNGYSIKNLKYKPTQQANQGRALFGKISEKAIIRNLGISGAKITAKTSPQADSNIAVLAGNNSGYIYNCYVIDSEVSVKTKSAPNIGVLCSVNNGKIENCYCINSTIKDASTKTTSGVYGGIAGANTGTVKNSYAVSITFSIYAKNTITPHPISSSNTENVYYSKATGDARIYTGGTEKDDAWFKSDAAVDALGKEYFAKDSANKNNGYLVLTFKNISVGGGDKTALGEALEVFPTEGYYTTNDRYNGVSTSVNGFWNDMQKLASPARTVYGKENATADEIEKAIKKLQDSADEIKAAIANLIPDTCANTTLLYEATQDAKRYVSSNYTPTTWAAFSKAKDEADVLMDSMFEAGEPTVANNPSANKEIQEKAASLRSAMEALDPRIGKSSLAQAELVHDGIEYLAKKFDPDTLTGYTKDSLNALREARDAALKANSAYQSYYGIGRKQLNELTSLFKELRYACYGLKTEAGTITVHLSIVDATSVYHGYHWSENFSNTEDLTLDANTSIQTVMTEKGFSNRFDMANQLMIYLNGDLYFQVNDSSSYCDRTNLDRLKLHDGDRLTLVWTQPKQIQNSSQDGGTYAALLTDVKDTFRYTTITTDSLEVEAGKPFTITVTADGAMPGFRTGTQTPVSGAKVYRSEAGETTANVAGNPVSTDTYAVTDENGNAELTLYYEGYTLINAFLMDEDGHMTLGPSIMVHVKKADDLSALKQQLRKELDEVYNDENYPESIFTSQNWQALRKAYEDGVKGIDEAENAGDASTAQVTAVQEIKRLQANADAGNSSNLTQFRRLLSELPEDVSKLDESAAKKIEQLKKAYAAMTKYQQDELTSKEKARYEAIISAKLGPAVLYQMQFVQKFADGVPEEAQAAILDMIDYLKMNTPKEDTYDLSGGNQIAKLFTFNAPKTVNYGYAFTDLNGTATALTEDIYACVSPEYAAYLLCRDAAIKAGKTDGPGEITGNGWTISDASTQMDVPDPTKSNTTQVLGKLTFTVGETQYEIRSIEVTGLDTAATNASLRFYDKTTYKGRAVTQCNQVVPDAFLRFTMPFDNVTITVTWGPAGGTDSELTAARTKALALLDAEYAKYADITDEAKRTKIDQAYEAGKADIVKAATVDGINEARAKAIRALAAAAADTDNSLYQTISGWGEGSGFNAGRCVGYVDVIMENTTCDGSNLTGENKTAAEYFYNGGKPFVNKTHYPIGENDNMMTVILRVLKENQFTWEGTGSTDIYKITYLASITGSDGAGNSYTLAQFTGGNESGWMGTLNDFFVNRSFSEFTVEDGKLADGDVIRVMYTTEGLGKDLGGTWGNSNTTLKSLEVEGGNLTSAFASGVPGGSYDYTLAIDGNSANIRLTPTATNKNYLVRTYLNVKDTGAAEGSALYKRTESILVTAGDVIYVGCGEPAWPSMNNQGTEARDYTGTWYALHVISRTGSGSEVNNQITALPAEDSLSYDNRNLYRDQIEDAKHNLDNLDPEAAKNIAVENQEKLDALLAKLDAYDALDELKAELQGMTLPAIGRMTDQAKLEKLLNAYNTAANSEELRQYLTDAEKNKAGAIKARLDELAAEKVISAIDAIGPVTKDSGAAIKAARDAYNELTDAQKKLVTNYDKLTAAEARWSELNPIPAGQPAQLPQNPSAGETLPFADVNANSWYYSGVKFAYEKGLMNGTGNGTFSPNADTTRGMIVTMLARLEGQNTSGTPWYAAGQKWAMDAGISDGTNMTGAITREQLAAILFRYAKQKGYDVGKSVELNGFEDANTVSTYATDAMRWAVASGLIQGSNSKLSPKATASRAQVATILMRFMELYAK